MLYRLVDWSVTLDKIYTVRATANIEKQYYAAIHEIIKLTLNMKF